MQLGLYVVGYKEASDPNAKKFVPTYRVLARLHSFSNPGDERYRWSSYTQQIRITDIEEWYLSKWERENEIYTFRFGFLKLAPLVSTAFEEGHHFEDKDLPSGFVNFLIKLFSSLAAIFWEKTVISIFV